MRHDFERPDVHNLAIVADHDSIGDGDWSRGAGYLSPYLVSTQGHVEQAEHSVPSWVRLERPAG